MAKPKARTIYPPVPLQVGQGQVILEWDSKREELSFVSFEDTVTQDQAIARAREILGPANPGDPPHGRQLLILPATMVCEEL